MAAEMLRAVPQASKLANFDMNKDGTINSGDQGFQSCLHARARDAERDAVAGKGARGLVSSWGRRVRRPFVLQAVWACSKPGRRGGRELIEPAIPSA